MKVIEAAVADQQLLTGVNKSLCRVEVTRPKTSAAVKRRQTRLQNQPKQSERQPSSGPRIRRALFCLMHIHPWSY